MVWISQEGSQAIQGQTIRPLVLRVGLGLLGHLPHVGVHTLRALTSPAHSSLSVRWDSCKPFLVSGDLAAVDSAGTPGLPRDPQHRGLHLFLPTLALGSPLPFCCLPLFPGFGITRILQLEQSSVYYAIR